MTQNIPLTAIRIDGGTQAREALNQDAVAEYAEFLDDDRELPPVDVFHDGVAHWLGDGFHRFFAYQKRDRASIPANVHKGTQRDAVLFACGANAHHGLRRTMEDKRKAVRLMLNDAEWSKMTDREIAAHCGVSHTLVGGLRNPEVAKRRDENRAKSAAKKAAKVEPGSTIAGGINAPVGAPQFGERPDLGVVTIDARTKPPTEAEKVAQEAHGDTDIVELLDETQRDLEAAQKTIAAMREDDKAAAIEKWQRLADVAQRRQGELQDAVKKRDDELKWYQRQLNRIGKAVGEDDPSKVAAVVEAMVRSQKKVPA